MSFAFDGGQESAGLRAAVTFVSVAQGGAGTTLLAAAVAGKKHKVMGGMLTMNGIGTVQFTDSVGNLTGPMKVADSGGFVWDANGNVPYTQTGAVNRDLNLVTGSFAANGVIVILSEP